MKNSTTADKRQNPGRLIIQGEDGKQKHEQRGKKSIKSGIICSPDAA